MAGRKRKVNSKAKTRDVSAGANGESDENLGAGMDDDPDAVLPDDAVLSDDAEDMATDGSDTVQLPTISDISGAAATASARRRVEDYLEMRRAARELNELEDFYLD